MNNLLLQYFPILIFFGIAVGLASLILLASLIVARQKPDNEKLSAYECGFEPFEDARIQFDVRFYLVAILFIIFDLEVAFLFPFPSLHSFLSCLEGLLSFPPRSCFPD